MERRLVLHDRGAQSIRIPKGLQLLRTAEHMAFKFACAQSSTTLAAYVSYPFDTVSRCLQIRPRDPNVSECTEAQCIAFPRL